MDKSVPRGCVAGKITPPCSKSYAQRALAAALLTDGESVLRNLEFCSDTLSAIGCIETLGAKVRHIDDRTIAVTGGLSPRAKCIVCRRIGSCRTPFHSDCVALRLRRYHRGHRNVAAPSDGYDDCAFATTRGRCTRWRRTLAD